MARNNEQAKEDVSKLYCVTCGKSKREVDFYSATNKVLYKSGRVHICKDCIKKFCYIDKEINIEKFKKILMVFDMPYRMQEMESAILDKNDTIGTYFKNIQLNHKTETWEYGDRDNKDFVSSIESLARDDFKVTPDMLLKWGSLSKEDVEYLENNYYQWTTRHECESKAQEILFEEICQMQLDIKKTREGGGDVIKKVEALQKLFQSANIRPLDQSAIQSNESAMIIGNMIATMEKTEPAEFFEEHRLKEYRDYMGYQKYFDVWCLRPLKNLLTGSKDFNIDYNIEVQEDSKD